MADLSTLDETQPTGSGLVSDGDLMIRQTRDSVKTSFGSGSGSGTQTAEHYLKGMHKFPNGNLASRPTVGNAGRVYFNTEHGRLELDNGANWVQFAGVQVGTNVPSGFITCSTSYGVISGMSVTVSALAGSKILVWADLTHNHDAVGTVFGMEVRYSTGAVLRDAQAQQEVGYHTMALAYAGIIASTASYTVEVRAKKTGTATVTAGGVGQGFGQLIVAVV